MTLEKWLKDNSYLFLKNALSEYLGIETIEDISIISIHDIRDFFDALKSSNSNAAQAMNLTKRIHFKKCLLKLAKEYSAHLRILDGNINSNNSVHVRNTIKVESECKDGGNVQVVLVLPRWEETLA